MPPFVTANQVELAETKGKDWGKFYMFLPPGSEGPYSDVITVYPEKNFCVRITPEGKWEDAPLVWSSDR